MARYVTTVESPLPVVEAFGFMADLRNFAVWDPGVRAVTQVEGDAGGSRSVFDVDVESVGGTLTLRYVTTRFEPPRVVQVEARSRMLTSIDVITVEPDDANRGSIVVYDATLQLNGPFRAFDLLLRPVFNRIGNRAAAGLRRALGDTGITP
jgi:hypothetical protein